MLKLRDQPMIMHNAPTYGADRTFTRRPASTRDDRWPKIIAFPMIAVLSLALWGLVAIAAQWVVAAVS
jgi:hypothetical protein